MNPMIEKHTVMVLNIGHIGQETAEMIEHTRPTELPFIGGMYGGNGYFAIAHETDYDGKIPADIFAVMTFARERGCSCVMLDCDARRVEGLPFYER